MDVAEIEKYRELVVSLTLTYAPKVALALFTLLLGLWLVSGVIKVFRRGLEARKVDATLTPFLSNLLGWILKVMLFISVASILGVQTTSFVAVLGAAGLAIGLALQGSLQNFAGGVIILIFRPFKVGDFIKAQGEIGTVLEIQIFNTVLLSPQNRRVIVPNGGLSNGTITNFTSEQHVRVDCSVGVAYDADLQKAKAVLLEMVKSTPKVLPEPAPVVAVTELGDNSVNLVVRPFTRPADYWDVHFAITEGCKRVLDEAGVTIPFPQRDVHLYRHDA